ncbi:hypothetical protein VdG1_02741 [Verticillium dahliae VDG1]|nr:hypothetical protein VdG2_04753 [Verticillium dahliae VDG2]KAF3358829.1 hypothetical protein VdG1_02741 [Verticillium dahliae VDG1]
MGLMPGCFCLAISSPEQGLEAFESTLHMSITWTNMFWSTGVVGANVRRRMAGAHVCTARKEAYHASKAPQKAATMTSVLSNAAK